MKKATAKPNNKRSINNGKQKSALLRKAIDGMTTLQMRQFFKSSTDEQNKKVLRNLLWALNENEKVEERELAEQIKELEAKKAKLAKERSDRQKAVQNFV
jgi:hypothetical protein